MTRPLCTIIGHGQGLGMAYARTFQKSGYDLALASRSGTGFDGGDRKAKAYSCNAGDAKQVQKTLAAVERDFERPIDLLIYNADTASFGTLDEITEETLENAWRASVAGLYACARYLAPGMIERGSGTIIVTGATASLRGNLWTTAFAPAKSAQRVLAQSLAKQLGPKGIHVGYLIIDGVIDTADTRANFAPNEPDEFFMKAAKIAEAALYLVSQDRSAWTFELDLRPFGEKW